MFVRKIICSRAGKWAYVVHTLGRVIYQASQVSKFKIFARSLTITDHALVVARYAVGLISSLDC